MYLRFRELLKEDGSTVLYLGPIADRILKMATGAAQGALFEFELAFESFGYSHWIQLDANSTVSNLQDTVQLAYDCIRNLDVNIIVYLLDTVRC